MSQQTTQTKKKSKVVPALVTLGVILGGIGYLFYSSAGEAFEYYKHVDEVMSDAQAWQGKRLQLHGYATDVRQRPGTLEYRFKVQNKGSIVNASYTGIVPDTFKGEAEVVLRGKLTSSGFHTEPNGVTAKCPSKYEAQQTAAATPGT